MSAVHMFDTYNTPNYEEELRNREVPSNAVNVLAALKETIHKVYSAEYYTGYILYRCQVIHDNVEYQIKLRLDTETRIWILET